MASRSATVLVIFVIAIIAFCLASVFGAMTGPISIFPNETDNSGGILDNLSAITDGTGDTGKSYGYENYNDYSSSSSSDSSSNVETTTDTSSSGSSHPDSSDQSADDSSSDSSGSSSGSSSSNVETTTG